LSVGDWVVIGACVPLTVVFGVALLALIRTIRLVERLSEVPLPPDGTRTPTVTVITPACDEEASVEATVRSFLAQRGVELDVIAVDDRSRDRTGELLDRLAAEDPRVAVTHVRELPDGWLGKVHALDVGVRSATGDFLLFVDADVRLSESTLARAIAYAESRRLDLVSAYPEIESAGFFGDVAWNFIGVSAGVGAAPWKLRDAESDHAFSVGAFILVRRSAFEETPGFGYIRLEVADDMGLSILMKDHGYACDLVNGRGDVRLHWYTSLRDMIVRSQKNFFGIMCRFSLARGVAIALLTAALGLFPMLALVPTTSPLLTALPTLPLALLIATAVLHARWAARPVLPSFFAPVGALLLAYTVLRAAVIGARIGGITWRGVFYRSAELREVQRFQM